MCACLSKANGVSTRVSHVSTVRPRRGLRGEIGRLDPLVNDTHIDMAAGRVGRIFGLRLAACQIFELCIKIDIDIDMTSQNIDARCISLAIANIYHLWSRAMFPNLHHPSPNHKYVNWQDSCLRPPISRGRERSLRCPCRSRANHKGGSLLRYTICS